MAADQEMEIQVPKEIVLKFPFDWGKENPEKVSSITVRRRLKAKDFKGIKAGEIRFDDMIKLISRMTGESTAKIEELDSADMMEFVEVVNSFLPGGQTTGEDG